jgi:hypothetical protein
LTPASSERSATRAERLPDLIEPKVAIASTSVPPAVAIEEIVDQSAIGRAFSWFRGDRRQRRAALTRKSPREREARRGEDRR